MPEPEQTIVGDVVITGNLEVVKGINDVQVTDLSTATAKTESNTVILISEVDGVLADLSDFASDSKLTPVEKLQIKRVWEAIAAEYTVFKTRANRYGITTGHTHYDNYLTAYETLDDYLNLDPTGVIFNLATTTDITGTTLRTRFSNYFQERQDLEDAVANQDIATPPPEESLVLHLSLDDAGADELQDTSGNGNVATPVGSPTAVKGKNFNCLSFSGTNQYLTVAHSAELNLGTGAFTLSIWVNTDDTGTAMYFFTPRSGNNGFLFQKAANDKALFALWSSAWREIDSDAALSPNTWYHIMITRSVGGLCQMYVNGLLQAETMTFSDTVSSSATWYIATDYDGTDDWDGELDEIRVYNVELSQSEVNFLHQVPGGPNQSVMTEESHSSLSISHRAINLKSVDTTNLILADMPKHDDTGLICYLPFNRSLEDKSEKGHVVSLGNLDVPYVASRFGWAVQFSGQNTYLTMAHTTDLNLGTGAFSISLWLNSNVVDAAWRHALTNRASATEGFYLMKDSVTQKLVFASWNGSAYVYNYSDVAIVINTWYHVVITRSSGGLIQMYVDGVLQADTETNAATMSTSTTWYIAQDYTVAAAKYWDGEIDELRVYNTELTLNEVAALLLDHPLPELSQIIDDIDLAAHWTLDEPDGTVINDIIGDHHGILTPGAGAWDESAGKVSGAFHFDGAASEGVVPAHADFDVAGNDFAISVWFNLDTDSNGNIFYTTAGSEFIDLWYSATNNWISFDLDFGGTVNYVDSRTILPSEGWFHLVVQIRGTQIEMYLNGVLQASDALVSLGSYVGGGDVFIGSADGTYFWDGYIDDLRFYNRALAYGEVKSLYRNPGGTGKQLVTKRSHSAASLTSRALIFTGKNEATDNDEIWNENNGDLNVLNYSCVSDRDARVPEEKTIVMIPGVVKDSDQNNTDIDNQLARVWSGLNNLRVNTIGVFKKTSNWVTSPEDQTTVGSWAATGTLVAALTDQSFKGHRFTELPSTTNGAYISQNLVEEGADGIKSFRIIVKKDTAETDVTVGVYDATGTAWLCQMTIDWSGPSVTATVGTKVSSHWYASNTIVEITAITISMTVASNNQLRLYPSLAGQGTILTTAVMVEDSIYPTPYAPTIRPSGALYFKDYTWQSSGKISLWFKPFFSYDVADNKWIISDYNTNGANSYRFGLFYYAAGNQFYWQVIGATTSISLTAGYASGAWASGNAFANNADLWENCGDANGWIYFEMLWDQPNDEFDFRINGASIASSTATIGAIVSNKNLSIGGIPLHSAPEGREADGLITDLAIWDEDDTSDTHYSASAAKPYLGQYSISNKNQSLTISRKSIQLQSGEFNIVDKVGRSIDIGSQGIRAFDKSGRVIHDIIDGPLANTDMQYGGHIYFRTETGGRIGVESVDTTSTAVSGTTSISTNNTDLSSFLPAGITNPSGVLISVWLDLQIDWGKIAAGTLAYAQFCYSLTYNSTTQSEFWAINEIIADAIWNAGGGSSPTDGNVQARSQAIVPIVWEAGVPYLVWGVYASFSGMGAANGDFGHQCYVDLQGFLA